MPQEKTATISPVPVEKRWAYYGTDDSLSLDRKRGESGVNSWAAAAVWLSMTTNPDLLNDDVRTEEPVDVDIAGMSEAFGLSEACVSYIRGVAMRDAETLKAFRTVAGLFVSLGFGPGDTDTYPPKFCVGITDIKTNMAWVSGLQLEDVPVPDGMAKP